jgi:hypothetical protein
MLKKVINFTDYEGNPVTRTYYFDLNKIEMIRINLSFQGGVEKFAERAFAERNEAALFDAIYQIILASYGERNPDDLTFDKLDDNGRPLKYKFEGSKAFEVLMLELMEPAKDGEDSNLVKFLNAVMPATEEAKKNAAAIIPIGEGG